MNTGNLLRVLLAAAVMVARVEAEEPAPVRPSAGTFAELRRASTEVATTVGEQLDNGHDWVYRRLQGFLENIDTRFGRSEREPIVVPLSPLRIGFNTEFLQRNGGVSFSARPDFEASLLLPNIERRLKIFITSADLPESPGDPALERNPVRAGVRIAPRSNFDFDLGVRAKLRPSAFAALKWARDFNVGVMHAYPFAKTYVESGVGIGASGALTLERRSGFWIARSASFANWLRNAAATDWTQSFMLGYARAVIQEGRNDRLATGHDLACGGVARMTVSGDRASRATAYEASLLYKRPLHGGWLYGYVEPVVRWERGSGWHPDTGIRIGFDVLFWGLAALPAEVASYCR